MNLMRILALLTRRWYVALAVFLVLAAAFVLAYALYPTQYTSRAVTVLTLPPNSGRISVDPRVRDDVTNPLLNSDEALSTSAAILIAAANAPATTARLQSALPAGTSYTVTNGSSNPELTAKGPFVYVDTTSSSAQDAQRTATAVDQYLRSDLQARQTALQAPAPTFISLVDVVPPTPGEAQRAGKLQAAAAAAVLCLVLTVVVTDRVDARRRPLVSPERPPATDASPRPAASTTNGALRPGARSSGRPHPGRPPAAPTTPNAPAHDDDAPTETVALRSTGNGRSPAGNGASSGRHATSGTAGRRIPGRPPGPTGGPE